MEQNKGVEPRPHTHLDQMMTTRECVYLTFSIRGMESENDSWRMSDTDSVETRIPLVRSEPKTVLVGGSRGDAETEDQKSSFYPNF